MDKSTHEKHLSQPFQTINKQFKIAIFFLSVYNGIFNVTNSNNTFYFKKSLINEDFKKMRVAIGAYEIKILNDEFKRIMIDQKHYTESDYPFNIKPKFSTLGNIVEIKPQGATIGFVFEDSIGNLFRIWWDYNTRRIQFIKKTCRYFIIRYYFHTQRYSSRIDF